MNMKKDNAVRLRKMIANIIFFVLLLTTLVSCNPSSGKNLTTREAKTIGTTSKSGVVAVAAPPDDNQTEEPKWKTGWEDKWKFAMESIRLVAYNESQNDSDEIATCSDMTISDETLCGEPKYNKIQFDSKFLLLTFTGFRIKIGDKIYQPGGGSNEAGRTSFRWHGDRDIPTTSSIDDEGVTRWVGGPYVEDMKYMMESVNFLFVSEDVYRGESRLIHYSNNDKTTKVGLNFEEGDELKEILKGELLKVIQESVAIIPIEDSAFPTTGQITEATLTFDLTKILCDYEAVPGKLCVRTGMNVETKKYDICFTNIGDGYEKSVLLETNFL